jgi:hypothetical protein
LSLIDLVHHLAHIKAAKTIIAAATREQQPPLRTQPDRQRESERETAAST